jgi:hypothetical protein
MRGQYQNPNNTPWSKILIGLAALIFVILIIKFIGGRGPSLEEATVTLRLADVSSNAQISAGEKAPKNVNANTPLSPLDLVEVKNGTAQINFLSNSKNILNMNTGTKLRYLGEENGKSSFRLENKDLWIQSDTAGMTFDLIGVSLTPSSTTVMNISKNELFTTITVLQGSASLNLGGSLLEIVSGKQLNYSTLKTLTIEDLTSRITPINPDSLSSDWMKLNNASAYVATTNPTTTTPTDGTTNGGLILFDSPVDESTVETKSITVTGRVLSPSVSRLIINGTPATIDPAKQTFSLGSVALTAKENNIVYRTFDVAGGLLGKGVVTVYTTANGTGTTSGTSTRAQVETYKPDNRFRIVAPSADFYETRETKVKIEGRVTANVAHHITINDFRLGSFAVNGTSWYYFANQQFGNMQEGVNTYTIRYFDAEDNEIYKQLFVIKKLPAFTSTGRATTLTSWEASAR